MIDVHTHLHPPKLARAIRKWFAENSQWNLTFSTEPADVARELKASGVSRFVFCSYAHKPGIAADINEWLIQTSEELDRFGLPLATVHPADSDYVDYYERALEHGCIGIKIHEDVQKLHIDDPVLAPIHEATSANNGFTLVHVGHIPWSDDTQDGPARVQKVLDRHPELRIVVAHMGAPDTLKYLELTSDYPNLFIDTTMAVNPMSPMSKNFSRELMIEHADHILFGSDYPNTPYSHQSDVDCVRQFVANESACRSILTLNAQALLERCEGSLRDRQ